MSSNILFSLVFLLWIFHSNCANVSVTLVISYVQTCPDSFCRLVIGCNGSFPCPPIQVTQGDTLSATFVNNLGTGISIHWHGIFQHGANEMDGVSYITQCDFINGETFTYTFTLRQSGTYWYHSHESVQYVDGLRGAFIILNPNNTFQYDYDATLEMADWYHTPATVLLPGYLASSTGNEPVPDSALINGVGQSNCTLCPFSVLEVPQNSVIRLRLINEGAMGVFTFSIPGFPLTVIEVDGVEVVPVVYDAVRINVAQRYSVLIYTNQSAGIYYMQAAMDPTVWFTPPTVSVALGQLIINSTLTPNPTLITPPVPATPTVLSGNNIVGSLNNITILIESPAMLQPLIPNPPPPVGNATWSVQLGFDPNIEGVNQGFMSGIHFQYPAIAAIDSIRASQPLPDYVNSQRFGYGDILDFILYNSDTGEHPIHMHGHTFYVLGMGNVGDGPYEINFPLDLVSPVTRDTATVNAASWLYIRVVLQNPGVWILHCHIDWHVNNGIGVIIVEAPAEMISYLGALNSTSPCPL